MATDFTPEQFAKWPTISSVVAELTKQFGSKNVAVQELCNRLKDKLVLAYAATAIFPNVAGSPDTKLSFVLIPPIVWESLQDSEYSDLQNIWVTSSHSHTEHRRTHGYTVENRFYDVRVEPDTLTGFLAKQEPEVSPDKDADAEKSDRLKPYLPDDMLQKWFDLYQGYYSDTKPLSHAVESAKGMFRDRSVGRDRVTDLFEGRTRGPKKRPVK